MNEVDKVKKLVLEESKDWEEFSRQFLRFHVKLVVDYAVRLAGMLGADKEVVAISAWLHDQTIQTHGDKDHNVTGAKHARDVLGKIGFSEEKIRKICDSIETHRCKDGLMPKTLEAKILASADAMAHFDMPLFLPWIGKRRGKSLAETLQWMKDKGERDWNRKMFFPEAKEMIRHKYEMFMELVEDHLKLLGNG